MAVAIVRPKPTNKFGWSSLPAIVTPTMIPRIIDEEMGLVDIRRPINRADIAAKM